MQDAVNLSNLMVVSRLVDVFWVGLSVFAGVFPAVWLALRLASRRND